MMDIKGSYVHDNAPFGPLHIPSLESYQKVHCKFQSLQQKSEFSKIIGSVYTLGSRRIIPVTARPEPDV